MLNPPPALRLTGPLFSTLTCVTLCTTTAGPSATSGETVFSSQTHTIPLSTQNAIEAVEPDSHSVLSRREMRVLQTRKLREQAGKSGFGGSLPWERERVIPQERQTLSEGLIFPGLWVGEGIGKQKEFRLELKIAQPGIDHDLEPRDVRRPGHKARRPQHEAPTDNEEVSAESLGLNESSFDPVTSTLHEPLASDSSVPATLDSAQIMEPPVPATWATLPSAPLTVVSKPSQKTGRARSLASCLTEDDKFALIIRINSQTVRTKYMKLDTGEQPRMVSRTGTWSPFRFEIVQRATPWESDTPRPMTMRARAPGSAPLPETLTYGSIIAIVDVNSGLRSEPVKLVRVDKNEVVIGKDEGHPVSELHRVAFARHTGESGTLVTGSRSYLSAPGARAGGGEMLSSKETSHATLEQSPDTGMGLDTREALSGPATKKRRTRRIALAKATLEESDPTASGLIWQTAVGENRHMAVDQKKPKKGELPSEDHTRQEYVERLEDWMCWIITSVECCTYTVFGPSVSIPKLDPVPYLLSEPKLHVDSLTLDLLVTPISNELFDVYIGEMGPLEVSVWRSASIRDNCKMGDTPAVRIDGQQEGPIRGRTITSAWPSHLPHHHLVVELPSAADLASMIETDVSGNGVPRSSEEEGWMAESEPMAAGELTIQEALRNAEDALQRGLDMSAFGEQDIAAYDTVAFGEAAASQDLSNLPEAIENLSAPTLTLCTSSVPDAEHKTLPLVLVRRSDGVGFGLGKGLKVYNDNGHRGEWW